MQSNDMRCPPVVLFSLLQKSDSLIKVGRVFDEAYRAAPVEKIRCEFPSSAGDREIKTGITRGRVERKRSWAREGGAWGQNISVPPASRISLS